MTARQLRVLHVSARFLPQVGGIERHIFEVASRLPAHGVSAEVLTTDATGSLQAEETISGIRVTRVPAWPRDWDLHIAPRLYRPILDGDWDVVHVQGVQTFVPPLAMAAARHARTPAVVTLHSGGHSSAVRSRLRPLQWLALRPLLRHATRLVAVSRFERDLFRRQLALGSGRFAVIPNGSELLASDDGAPAPELVDRDLIVSVGRVERYKGHWRLLEAMPHVRLVRPAARLRIVGDGADREPLTRRSAELGLADCVEIAPIAASDRAAMIDVLRRAGVVALLSEYESQGIAVMEALSLGRPAVVADGTALSELAARGWARAVPRDAEPEVVATALLQELAAPARPPVPLPTWGDAARRLATIYREVAGRR